MVQFLFRSFSNSEDLYSALPYLLRGASSPTSVIKNCFQLLVKGVKGRFPS